MGTITHHPSGTSLRCYLAAVFGLPLVILSLGILSAASSLPPLFGSNLETFGDAVGATFLVALLVTLFVAFAHPFWGWLGLGVLACFAAFCLYFPLTLRTQHEGARVAAVLWPAALAFAWSLGWSLRGFRLEREELAKVPRKV